MTTWTERPDDWGKPGHANRGDEYEAVADKIDDLSTSVDDDWVDWTPTLTNLTLGNGSVLAQYKQIGFTVWWNFKFILGSTSAVGNTPSFTPPVATASDGYAATQDQVGSGQLIDTGTANREAAVLWSTSTSFQVWSYSTTGVITGITSTVPHTWATTDVITLSGFYRAAAAP